MNYNLVIDTSNFKPFDISPAMQILHDYRDAYYRLEDQINKIAEEKGQYVLPDTPENQEYRNIMNKYNTDYDAVVDDFSRGMNTENARRIRDIRRRYHSEVSPINKAIEAYNKDLDKMTALGADAIVGNRKRSIRDYYGGINPGIEYRSDKAIQEVAAGVMQGLDNALMNAPEKVADLAGQYFAFRQRGLDGAAALGEILKHDPQLNSQQGAADATQLINALEKVYKHYAFKEGTPENEDIWTSVVNGALKGIQAPKYTIQADQSYLNDYQKAQMALTNIQADMYKDNIESQITNRRLYSGFVPEIDETTGREKRDANGNIIYKKDDNEAARLLALRRADNASTPTNPKNRDNPPKDYYIMDYNGRRYAVKPGSSRQGKDWDYQVYDEENDRWGSVSVTERQMLYDEYKRLTNPNSPEAPKDSKKDEKKDEQPPQGNGYAAKNRMGT